MKQMDALNAKLEIITPIAFSHSKASRNSRMQPQDILVVEWLKII